MAGTGWCHGQGARYPILEALDASRPSPVDTDYPKPALPALDELDYAFGISVALSGDTLIFGARKKGNAQGAAYIFARSGDSWSQQQVLTARDGASRDEFGVRVALNKDTALVGTLRHAPRGAAYVFVRSSASWSQQEKFESYDTMSHSSGSLGHSVALGEDTAIVGGEGRMHVFIRSGASWSLQELVTCDAANDRCVSSVSLCGSTALVGDYGKAGRRGVAYLFVLSGGPDP